VNLFLDACALIYRFEGAAEFRDATARRVAQLTQLSRGKTTVRLGVSRLSLLECRVKPLREGDAQTLRRYDDFFAEVEIIEMDAPAIDLATRLRALHGLKTPDAIQAASALVWQPDAVFVTGDAAFGKVPGLNVQLINVPGKT
jgi:uncharacterized protein